MEARQRQPKLKNDKKLKRMINIMDKIVEETSQDHMDFNNYQPKQHTAALMITNEILPPKPQSNPPIILLISLCFLLSSSWKLLSWSSAVLFLNQFNDNLCFLFCLSFILTSVFWQRITSLVAMETGTCLSTSCFNGRVCWNIRLYYVLNVLNIFIKTILIFFFMWSKSTKKSSTLRPMI